MYNSEIYILRYNLGPKIFISHKDMSIFIGIYNYYLLIFHDMTIICCHEMCQSCIKYIAHVLSCAYYNNEWNTLYIIKNKIVKTRSNTIY